MDFGDDDTNNPFVGSSYDAFDNNIDNYFSGMESVNKSVLHDPYRSSNKSSNETDYDNDDNTDDDDDDEHMNNNDTENDDDDEDDERLRDTTGGSSNIGEYSIIGLPMGNSTLNTIKAGPQEIEIIATDTINGIVFYVVKLSNGDMVKRRYSDFQSLRINLVKFFPTKIIPVIPEKHSLKDYFNGNKTVRNNLIVDFRKRKFNSMLNYLNADPEIRNSIIFKKFIDPDEEIWLEVLRYAPFTLLPTNVLLSSPRDPTKPNPYYSYLPIPPMASLKNYDSPLNQEVFKPLELQFLKYKAQLAAMEKQCKKMVSNLKDLTMKKVELGANFNVFSLLDSNVLIEKTGQAVDIEFINLEVFIKNFIVGFKEPLQDLKNQCIVALNLLSFRKFKEIQLQFLKSIILKKQARSTKLISTENLHLKLDIALKKGAEESPTIAEAVRRLELEKLKRHRKTRDEEEEELLNNSAILNASSPIKTINARKTGQKRGAFNVLFGGGGRNNKNSDATATYIETKDIQLMTSQERLNELTYINQELLKLQNCFELSLKDAVFLDMEIEKNCHRELLYLKLELVRIAKNLEKILLIYCKEANHWPQEE